MRYVYLCEENIDFVHKYLTQFTKEDSGGDLTLFCTRAVLVPAQY